MDKQFDNLTWADLVIIDDLFDVEANKCRVQGSTP